ncbi:MAG: 4-carboxymuconolactone decarboxylase [Paracoccaceae bacterium]|jgi:4-carboxymuconolactone decarboxylase
MKDPTNPFEAMMKQAQEMAKAFNPAMESFVPKGFESMFPTMSKDVMEMMFGKGLNAEGLDAKTRLLLTLSGLTIQGALAEPQIQLTVRHALEAGASKQEIAETIGQSAMFGGVPAMNKAMELATKVIDGTEEKDA